MLDKKICRQCWLYRLYCGRGSQKRWGKSNQGWTPERGVWVMETENIEDDCKKCVATTQKALVRSVKQ